MIILLIFLECPNNLYFPHRYCVAKNVIINTGYVLFFRVATEMSKKRNNYPFERLETVTITIEFLNEKHKVYFEVSAL